MPQPEDPGKPPKEQAYVVKVDFTDEKGRTWSAGSAFTGTPEQIRKALAVGQIAEKPAAEPKTPAE